jgi:hypothetical protein
MHTICVPLPAVHLEWHHAPCCSVFNTTLLMDDIPRVGVDVEDIYRVPLCPSPSGTSKRRSCSTVPHSGLDAFRIPLVPSHQERDQTHKHMFVLVK